MHKKLSVISAEAWQLRVQGSDKPKIIVASFFKLSQSSSDVQKSNARIKTELIFILPFTDLAVFLVSHQVPMTTSKMKYKTSHLHICNNEDSKLTLQPPLW